MSDLSRFLQDHPDIDMFEVMLPDFNGRLRGKWVPRTNIEKVFTGGLKIPLSTLAFDIWGNDPEGWVFENGDADGVCVADVSTLAPVPWLERPTGQVLLALHHPGAGPAALDTRLLVEKLEARLAQHQLTPVLASEMEFHLLAGFDAQGKPRHTQTSSDGTAAIGGDTYGIDIMQDHAELLHQIRDASVAQGLPIDTLIKEAAPSQYEVNLYHRACALQSADQGLLLRRVIKGVAKQHGLHASFMAKTFMNSAGNGMHVHCSVLDASGNNAFDDGTGAGTPLLQHAVAGCLATMADCMLLFAPHLNSYRRFGRGNHAPLTPNWGYENRTVALRIPADKHEATRIEHRVAGADASVHLVYAALLAGILYGLENKLSAPPPVSGNAYEQETDQETGQQANPLPDNWPAALQTFRNSEFINTYFGPEFQRVYGLVKAQEIDQFAKDISPFEYATYL